MEEGEGTWLYNTNATNYDNLVTYSDVSSSISNTFVAGNGSSKLSVGESVEMKLDGEVFDMRSMFYLLKILMKKNGIPEDLLVMDFDEMKEFMDREVKIDNLLDNE